MSRRLGVLAFISLFAVSLQSSAQFAKPAEVTGTWKLTWDNDNKNVNPATLKYAAGTIAGFYTNDSKEKCPIAGRVDTDGITLILNIVCPKWEIRTEGRIKNAKLVEGSYTAYGSSKGEFKMSR